MVLSTALQLFKLYFSVTLAVSTPKGPNKRPFPSAFAAADSPGRRHSYQHIDCDIVPLQSLQGQSKAEEAC